MRSKRVEDLACACVHQDGRSRSQRGGDRTSLHRPGPTATDEGEEEDDRNDRSLHQTVRRSMCVVRHLHLSESSPRQRPCADRALQVVVSC